MFISRLFTSKNCFSHITLKYSQLIFKFPAMLPCINNTIRYKQNTIFVANLNCEGGGSEMYAYQGPNLYLRCNQKISGFVAVILYPGENCLN